jgi:hypothetical protein
MIDLEPRFKVKRRAQDVAIVVLPRRMQPAVRYDQPLIACERLANG